MGLLPLRWLTRLLFPAAVLLLIAMWYYTDQLKQGAFEVDHSEPPSNVRILEVGEGRIRIAPLEGEEDSAWNADGLYGLEFENGYARVGRVIDIHADSVLRELTSVKGVPETGSEARIDTFVYRGDPRTALDIEFQELTITTPAGEGPAWLIPDSGDVWAIFIHGKGSSREEAFRILPVLREIGLPVLIPTYRNDEEFTSIEDGRYGYGETEWEDVTAAMDFAAERGAQRFVLLGNSMGGGIVMAVLRQPDYASRVAATVLDSPVLSLRKTVEFRAGQRGLPAQFTEAAMQFATWRDGVDWAKTDYLQDLDALTTPILLIHGDADQVVPVSTSEALARVRPDIVTFRKMAGVDHVQSWNADRELYRLQLLEFLRKALGR
jgi:uncharacterized protein